jgi:hypothetical protein
LCCSWFSAVLFIFRFCWASKHNLSCYLQSWDWNLVYWLMFDINFHPSRNWWSCFCFLGECLWAGKVFFFFQTGKNEYFLL